MSLALCACNTKSSADRAKEELERLQQKREASEASKAPPAPIAPLSLPEPYDLSQAQVLTADGRCPEGFWALFQLPPPGATPEEKAANEKLREELRAKYSEARFIVRLVGPPMVSLAPYDAPTGKFTVSLVGGITCLDSAGPITIAWGNAKAVSPKEKERNTVSLNTWEIPEQSYELKMVSLAKAKEFYAANRFGLAARVAFTLGKAEVDRKMKRPPRTKLKSDVEEVEFGGNLEDWGAGRLVRARLTAVRIAADHEKQELFDERPAAAERSAGAKPRP